MVNQLIQSFRQKLQTNTAFGIFSKTSDSAIVEAAGLAGLDFIILDMEHGLNTAETISHHVRAALLTGMTPIVRVKGLDPHAIGSALDMGAGGVQIPNIATAKDAQEAVKAARFYPEGMRGVCRFVRSAQYGQLPKDRYFQEANKAILVLQVEGKEGVENLDEILAVEGYDILFIGPYDLSQSVGKPGLVDSEEVLSLMAEIKEKCQAQKITLGSFSDSKHRTQFFLNEGFKYIAYSVDINIFLEAAKKILD
jgi:4-hydroxy-2-oxoheptanedioate aldolase